MTKQKIYATLMLIMTTNSQDPVPNPRGGYTPKKSRVKTNRVVLTRAIWYIFGFIAALLALRIVLLMLSANPETPFVQLIYGMSGIFVVPFYGIFDAPDYRSFYIDTSSIVGVIVYWLLAFGAAKLVNLTR